MSGVRWRGQGGQGYGGNKGLERRGAEGSLAWLGWVSEGQSGEMRLAGQWEMLQAPWAGEELACVLRAVGPGEG